MNQEFKAIQQEVNALAEHSEPTKNPDLSWVISDMQDLKQNLGVKHSSDFNSALDKLGKQLHEKLGLPPCNILDVSNGEIFTQEKVKGNQMGRVHVLDKNLNSLDDQVARSASQGHMPEALKTIENSMRGLSKDGPDFYRAKEAFSRALNEAMPGRAPVTIDMVNGKLIALDCNYQSLQPEGARPVPAAVAKPVEAPKPAESCPRDQTELDAPTLKVTDHRTTEQKDAAAKFWKAHKLDESKETNPDGGKTIVVQPGDNIWNLAAKETEERQGRITRTSNRGDMRNVLQLTRETADDNDIKITVDGKALIIPGRPLHIPAQR